MTWFFCLPKGSWVCTLHTSNPRSANRVASFIYTDAGKSSRLDSTYPISAIRVTTDLKFCARASRTVLELKRYRGSHFFLPCG